MLQAILDDHLSHPAPLVTVIPVVDDDLEQDNDLIEAIFRRYGGEYIAASRIEDAQVVGLFDPVLATATESFLGKAGLGYEVKVSVDGDLVRARLADGTLPLNPSQRTVMAVVAAIFSKRFHETELAGVSWNETTLDVASKRAVWELMTNQLNGRRVGTLSTLVSLTQGSVDPSLHCEGEPSARYVIMRGGFFRRKRPADLDAAISNLLRHKDEALVFLLGAGFSKSARMPLGNEFRDYALDQFFHPAPPTESELPYRLREWIIDNDRLLAGEDALSAEQFVARLTLERVLREEFHQLGGNRSLSATLGYVRRTNDRAIATHSPARTGLGNIARKARRIILLTVNFDTLVEAELGSGLQVLATPEDLKRSPSVLQQYLKTGGKIPLLKIHGTIDRPESIVADVESTALGLSGEVSEAFDVLLESGSPTNWTYLGYSMRDPDVNEIIGGARFSYGAFERWVSPLPDESVQTFAEIHRVARWAAAGAPTFLERVLTETADHFLSRLDELWT
jgi:hypothetical protein